jgi:hypothetical protein
MVLPLKQRDALFAQHQQRLAVVRDRTEQQGAAIWRHAGGIDDGAAAIITTHAQTALEAARIVVTTSVDAYTSTALELPPGGLSADDVSDDALDPDELAQASIVHARAAAPEVGLDRAVLVGALSLAMLMRSDVAHTATRALNQRLSADDARELVSGYRRAPDARACPFCITASTRKYHVGTLMPLHRACGCDVREIAKVDNEESIFAAMRARASGQDLEQQYRDEAESRLARVQDIYERVTGLQDQIEQAQEYEQLITGAQQQNV